MGLLEMLYGKDSAPAQWASSNQNWLGGLASGLAQPGKLSDRLGYAAQGAWAGKAADASAQEKLDATNQTKAWLHAQGFDDLVPLVDAGQGAIALTTAIQRKTAAANGGAQNMPASVQEYQWYADQERAAGRQPLSWMDYNTQKGGANERSLAGTYMRGPDGKVVMGQVNRTGTLDITQIPEGYEVIDPATMAGDKKTATVDAAAAGAARQALPGAEAAYDFTVKALSRFGADEEIMSGTNEQFGNVLGVIPQQATPAMWNTYKADFRNWVDQISGGAWLQVRQALKGAGQVTDYEGMKGEQAISRMRTAAERGTRADFEAALVDFKAALDNGMRLLREQANGLYAADQPAVTGPTGGGVVDYSTYFGAP